MTRPTHTSEEGAAAVEFALVLPLLVMLVIGIVDFGQAYNAKVELAGAAREGARSLALGGTAATAESVVQSAAPGVGSSVTFGTVTVCGSGASDASITVNYPLSYSIPFVASGTWTLTSTAVMRCEV